MLIQLSKLYNVSIDYLVGLTKEKSHIQEVSKSIPLLPLVWLFCVFCNHITPKCEKNRIYL